MESQRCGGRGGHGARGDVDYVKERGEVRENYSSTAETPVNVLSSVAQPLRGTFGTYICGRILLPSAGLSNIG